MKRTLTLLLALGGLAAVALVVAPLTATAVPAPSDTVRSVSMDDDDEEESPPCHRTEFETELVKKACAEGGQFAAKDAMKRFVREAKTKLALGEVDCRTCHDVLAPEYSLKADGMKLFNEWKTKLEAAK
ncbi:MAG: hypothetical protein EP329_28070 [Deltaproteobacteria bacterium]|nr:MAG: hypothetical protein EP329_28070 [Deltaproteobacteria bacterium]